MAKTTYDYLDKVENPNEQELVETEKLFAAELRESESRNTEQVLEAIDALESQDIKELQEGLLDFNRTAGGYKRKKATPQQAQGPMISEESSDPSEDSIDEQAFKKRFEQMAKSVFEEAFGTCQRCGAVFPRIPQTSPKQVCSLCESKLQRIQSISDVVIEISGPEYPCTAINGNKFALYVNIRNITERPIKAQISEFFLVSNGRQRIEETYLPGGVFLYGTILPWTTRCCARAWSLSSENEVPINIKDYLVITLTYSGIDHMFKFVFTKHGWSIDDYYETTH